MWKNYFKIGIRNILKYKVFSLINIFGLAMGMTVCMLIILMLSDQKSYDQFHEKKDRIYRVLSDEDNSKAANAVTSFLLANALKTDYPIIEESTHLTQGVGGDIIYNQKNIPMRGYFADHSFLQVFSFELEQGDKRNALVSPNSMVITKEIAIKLFNDENPIGKTVEFIDRGNGLDAPPVTWGLYTITGVIDSKNYKSHLKYDVLVSSSSLRLLIQANKISDFTNSWKSHQSYTYVLLIPDKDKEDLEIALNDLASHQYTGPEVPKGFKLFGQKLSEITPGMLVRNETRASLPMVAYYFLGVLAFLIMLSSCFNYTNLSIARALTRAKEIGIRKVSGANKKNLISQFLSESFITALFALILAIILLFFIKPAFKGLWVNQHLNFDLEENIFVYFIFLGFALLIGFIAGAYPALYLSKYSPTKALNNLYRISPGKLGLQKALSASQFVISLFFIITSILIYHQVKHFLEFEYGFTSQNIVNIELQGNDYQKISNAFYTIPGVSTISASDIIPATNVDNGISLKASGSEEEFKKLNILHVNENFIDNLELKLLAGKNLPAMGEADDRFILVNQAAVMEFGYQEPEEIIGQIFEPPYSSEEVLEVIGVVEDFRFKMLMNDHEIGPLVLRNQPQQFRYVNVHLASGNPMGTMAAMEEQWKTIDPVHPFTYGFYEDQLDAMYQGIFDIVSILGFIAFLSIFIACLGMLGMATYTTERRIKEVGIRKVMGADTFKIVLLLSKGFLKILLMSVFIGAPVTYMINNLWLQNIPNRVDFGFGTILLGTVILLVLGIITVGSQTIMAAIRNPVNSLRSE